MSNFSHRNAFTLIEILVVLIILSILAAMVTTAVSGVQTTAREARTKQVISVVDSVISEQYERLRYRPLPVEVPATATEFRNPSASDLQNRPILTYEVLADESARVRLMMLRDLQRMELPDRYSDISPASLMFGAASPIVQDNDTGEIISQRGDVDDVQVKENRSLFPIAWYNAAAPNPKYAGYLRSISQKSTREHQGAECLYLILSSSYVGGQPAIGAIPDSSIGDTDKDGMLEILDGWGQPLQFIRWPVGFVLNNATFSTDFEQVTTIGIPDDFDIFRADYAYTEGGKKVIAGAAGQIVPWSMKPLIFSVGEDGESGLATDPGLNEEFSYSHPDWFWPVKKPEVAEYFGNEQYGRDNGPEKIPYIDPYLRKFTDDFEDAVLPGELLGITAAELKKSFDLSIDNITNYQLQVSP